MLKLLRPNASIIYPRLITTAPASRLAFGTALPAAFRFYTRPSTRQQFNRPSDSTGRKYSTQAQPKISVFQRIKLAASFSFYAGIVLGGVGLLGLVIYYFVSELLLPSSDVQLFNKTFSIINKDPECQRILGKHMKAHGDASGNKWSRNRPVASRRATDGYGREHVWMQFHVEGELVADTENGALVRLEMIRDPHGSNNFEYRYLVLEVPGQPRIHLIDNTVKPHVKDKNVGFLGVKWGKKE